MRLQEEYSDKKKLNMCFVDLEKAFDRIPRKVLEWAMRKRGIPKVMVIVIDVVTDSVRNGLMSPILYADNLVLTSEKMKELREKFWKLKEAFQSKGLRVNLRKTKVVLSGAGGVVSLSKVDSCGNCGKRVWQIQCCV